MRFTDNAELTAANMTNTDILAGTDVSEQTDKKFSLAGLADWFLNRFTGLSLAGNNQSVKAALDGLNSTSNQKASGVATYVMNDVTANANGIRYSVRGKTLFVFINQGKESGQTTSDFVKIATIPFTPYIAANTFEIQFGNGSQFYQISCRKGTNATDIYIQTTVAAGFLMRATLSLPLD